MGRETMTRTGTDISATEASGLREFLFTYRFGGSECGTSVFASNPAEAKEKIKAVGMARYDGELDMRIPAMAGVGGLIARGLTWWRNRHPRQ